MPRHAEQEAYGHARSRKKGYGRGRPNTCCAMMLRWISDVPPAIVPEKLLAYRSNQLAK